MNVLPRRYRIYIWVERMAALVREGKKRSSEFWPTCEIIQRKGIASYFALGLEKVTRPLFHFRIF